MSTTLYKKTATGAIQTWRAEVDGARYRTHSGQLGGAITTTQWTDVEGKNIGRSNETTPERQAELEVASMYTHQRKRGYCDTPDGAESSTRFQCMLAEKYTKYEPKLYDARGYVLDVGGLFVQPKLDGIRCIAKREGLFSREGNRIIAVPHIERQLIPLFEAHPHLILDGELYNHDLKEDFNTIVSLVKKLKPTAEDLERSASLIQYWVYDIALLTTFSARLSLLESVSDGTIVVPVTTWYAGHRDDVDALYEECLKQGYEGAMVRVDSRTYENKRSSALLKRKEFLDEEFEILRIEEGVGNAAGLAKRAFVRLPNGGEAKVDVVGTREQLRDLLARAHEVVGKTATVEFQNWTPDGSLRFPKLKVIHHTGRW